MILKKITLLALLSLSAVSCVKAPEEDETPATAEEVGQAVVKAWDFPAPWTAKTNDFIYVETVNTIDSSAQVYFTVQEGTTVSSVNVLRDAEGRYIKYGYLHQHATIDQQGNQSALASRNEEYSFSMPECEEDPTTPGCSQATASSRASSLSPLDLPNPFEDFDSKVHAQSDEGEHFYFGEAYVASAAMSCFAPETLEADCTKSGYQSCEITCRNLKTVETLEPVPDLIKAQANCGGFSDCKWRTKTVSFDRILTVTKGAESNRQISNISVTMSPDLPYLARLTKYCVRQLVYLPQINNKLLVQSCRNLKNYKPGSQ